ncbi:MAG: hypothetical protein Fur007_16100 [Rhodoferax sp.]
MKDNIDRFFDEWNQQRKGGNWLPQLPTDIQYIYRIARICRLLGERLDATCARHDMTRSQFEAMAVLRRRAPQPQSAGDLMEAALLTSGSVTAMLNQMLGRGWIERQTSEADKRRIEIFLTEEGKQRIEAAISERISDNTRIARHLSAADRVQIDALLRCLLDALEADATKNTSEGTP